MMKSAAAVLLGSLLAATAASGQRITAEALAMPIEYRTLFQGTELVESGTWLGGRVELSHRALRLEAAALAGSLGGADVRTTRLAARAAVLPWLEAGAAAEARRFSFAAGETRWRLYGLTAQALGDLGLPWLRGFGEITLMPLASGTSAVAPTSAVRGVAGIILAPPRGRLLVRFGYRFERFMVDDPASPGRTEQLEGLMLAAGLGIGR